MLPVKVLLGGGSSKLELVAVVVVVGNSPDAARGRRSRKGDRGAVGSAREGPRRDGSVVGLRREFWEEVGRRGEEEEKR